MNDRHIERVCQSMPRRTVFLDVIDPSLPIEVQEAIEAKIDELKDFKELRPSIWKRFSSMFSRHEDACITEDKGAVAVLDAASCVTGACVVFEVCACCACV